MLMDTTTLPHSPGSRLSQYVALTKPRVTQLAVFCAVIGMFLSTPGMVPWTVLIGGTVGIWLVAGAAFAINCLVEQRVDALMRRTAWRPSARGEITTAQILAFSAVLGGLGMWTLYMFTNALTMWLTFATFIGYAVVYTLLLKPATPQNIVIGGASGAMPPALGWAAVTGHVPGDAWILVLIIFVWTPPHFWSLALYRRQDYENAGLPMLPNTHGEQFTRLHILLYSIILLAVSLMPFISQMSGIFYLASAVLLGAIFLAYAWKIFRHYSDALARRTFRYSIVYLSLLFAALLVDHYARGLIGV
jgi:heme o synthase